MTSCSPSEWLYSPAVVHSCAQSKSLSLKVSDKSTVPLCAIHHHQIHTTGKEREWWEERNIDPLVIANSLWQQSRKRYAASAEQASEENGIDEPEASQPNDKLAGSATASDRTANASRNSVASACWIVKPLRAQTDRKSPSPDRAR